jgi:hypothetical protein
MEQTAILGPFFGMIGLTLAVWLYLFVRRVPFILATDFGPDGPTPAKFAALSPPAVSNPSDNFKNLFELPVIFYALVLYLFAAQRVDSTYVTAAWVFFGFRVLHSAMHCTLNIVNVRFALYLVAALALWFMAIREALAQLAG